MGETISFNPEIGGYNLQELARDPLGASDEVQKLMRVGNYEEAKKLLDAVLNTQRGKGKSEEEPRQAMVA